MKIITRGAVRRLIVFLMLAVLGVVLCWVFMIRMPGESFRGDLPPLTSAQERLAADLRRDVAMLAGTIGERNHHRYEALKRSADFLETSLSAVGYRVERHGFEVFGKTCENLIVELPGTTKPDEIVVVGGHYDSVMGCPGANDNATGAAATLALSRLLAGSRPERTLRFVQFVNEEPPWFMTEHMGSLVYAKRCKERDENVVAMLSLETMGCFLDEPKSQRYPPPLSISYPGRGNFIAFVSNFGSRSLVRRAVGVFRENAKFPSEGGALPAFLPGVGWSDHWAFFKQGYDSVMVTDTAPFRYAHYHKETDTPDRVDYERLARVVEGLVPVVSDLAGLAR